MDDTLRQLSAESRQYVIRTKFAESRRQNLYRYSLHKKEEATRNINLNSNIYRGDILLLRQHLPYNELVGKNKRIPATMLKNILCLSANGDPFNPMTVLQAYMDDGAKFSERVVLENTDSFILSNHEQNIYILYVGQTDVFNPLLTVFLLLRMVEGGAVEEVGDIHAVKFLSNFARRGYTTKYWHERRNIDVKIVLADVSPSGLLNIGKLQINRLAQGIIAQRRLAVMERHGSLVASRNMNYRHKPLYERYTIRRGRNKDRQFLNQSIQRSQTKKRHLSCTDALEDGALKTVQQPNQFTVREEAKSGETQIFGQSDPSILNTPHHSGLPAPVCAYRENAEGDILTGIIQQ
ncbi:hypothetical protein DdX_18128 [Ditylenchus destructor]|uniref:Uncharacterized protein n=1 Tax=Ditylenchus destructor TaxID=166010 RepID=A0AAD4QV66_9BILA|nr:hypothetical protein DdX_18128 [Ditylenchus destructor]